MMRFKKVLEIDKEQRKCLNLQPQSEMKRLKQTTKLLLVHFTVKQKHTI